LIALERVLVAVVDTAGALSCTLDVLPDGDAVEFTVMMQVNADSTGVLTNLARVEAITPEANSGDEVANVDVQVMMPADLVVTISDNQDPVVAGSNLYFTTLQDDGSNLRDIVVVKHVAGASDGESNSGTGRRRSPGSATSVG
jgi:hypothetical protein